MNKTTKAIMDELKYIKKDLEWHQKEYDKKRDECVGVKNYDDADGWDKIGTGMSHAIRLINDRIRALNKI